MALPEVFWLTPSALLVVIEMPDGTILRKRIEVADMSRLQV
jgi:hypothetical protein